MSMLSTTAHSGLPESSSSEQEAGGRVALRKRIDNLKHIQYQVQCRCGKPFGYSVSLGTLLLFAGAHPPRPCGALPPSLEEAEVGALSHVFQSPEARAALDGLLLQFAPETSLEDIIQACVAEEVNLAFLLRAAGRDRSVGAQAV